MSDSKGSTTVQFVIGVIGVVIFGVAFVISLILFSLFGLYTQVFLILTIIFAALVVVFVLLLNAGRERKKVIARLSRYAAVLSDKNVQRIEDITAETGFSPKQIQNDMTLLKKWNLSFDLYMDNEETTLIKGKSNYSLYIETEKQRKEQERVEAEKQRRMQDPETATLEIFRDEGKRIQEKLRAANLLLPGEKISNSLYELERTTRRIFDHIENHPEKLPDTRKLMNYHLPTTIKLVDKYCQYDAMDYQPQNIADAKADIEKALDAANIAFVNYLEDLFRMDTLDVTTEAEVLTKVFEKDGLTGKKFDI